MRPESFGHQPSGPTAAFSLKKRKVQVPASAPTQPACRWVARLHGLPVEPAKKLGLLFRELIRYSPANGS